MPYIGQTPFQEFTNLPTKDSFTGDGSTVAFDMNAKVPSGSENMLEVFIDNVRQEPGTGKAYTLGLDGSNDNKRITFSAAPPNGAAIYVINDKTNTTTVAPLQNDLNGTELILDGDADTSITADSDDRIDFKIANTDHFHITTSSGDTVIQNMGDAKDFKFNQYDGRTILEINDAGYVALENGATGSGELRIYEDTDNGSNYTGFKVGTQSANIDYILPTADGTSGYYLSTNASGVLSWANPSQQATFVATTAFVPDASDGASLGSASLEFSDLFLADGATIQFGDDQEVALTHVHNAGLKLNSTMQLQFNDASQFINAPSATVLDINATDEIELNATLVDINANADISGTLTLAGNLIVGSATVTEAQLEILDGATVTTTELNLIDGGATVGTGAIADGDGLLINDAGTMRVSTVQTLAAYLDDEITSMPNLTTAAALVTVSALDTGSITSGFGNIDNGASNITSGGLVKLDVDADADDVTGDSATGRLTLGAGEDLNLYHGGTNSYIVNDTGKLNIQSAGSVVINENSVDSDFRVESNGNANMIFVDAGNDRVVIGGSNVTAVSTFAVTYPQAKTDTTTRYVHAWQSNDNSGQSQLRLQATGHADTQASRNWQFQSAEQGIANGGTIQFQPDGGNVTIGSSGAKVSFGDSEAVINEGSGDINFRVEGNGNANMIFVDAGNDKVAIGTATATATLTVAGSAVAKTDTDTSNTGNVTLDFTANQNFVLTLTGNTTLVNPTTENVGQSGFITFIQDGTGGRTVATGNQFFTPGNAAVNLSSAANAVDVVPYIVQAAGKILLGSPQLLFS